MFSPFLFVIAGIIVALVKPITLHEMRVKSPLLGTMDSMRLQIYKKRTAPFVSKGLAAMKSILPGTKRLDSSSASMRQYEKNGDFQTAEMDFLSFNPKNVRERNINTNSWNHRPMYGKVLAGTAGNTRLILREGLKDKPTVLDIVHFKMDPEPTVFTDRIFYRSETN